MPKASHHLLRISHLARPQNDILLYTKMDIKFKGLTNRELEIPHKTKDHTTLLVQLFPIPYSTLYSKCFKYMPQMPRQLYKCI